MRERFICYDQGYVDIVVVIAMYEVVIILLVVRLLYVDIWQFGLVSFRYICDNNNNKQIIIIMI